MCWLRSDSRGALSGSVFELEFSDGEDSGGVRVAPFDSDDAPSARRRQLQPRARRHRSSSSAENCRRLRGHAAPLGRRVRDTQAHGAREVPE